MNNIELITDRPLADNLHEIAECKAAHPDRAIVASLMTSARAKVGTRSSMRCKSDGSINAGHLRCGERSDASDFFELGMTRGRRRDSVADENARMPEVQRKAALRAARGCEARLAHRSLLMGCHFPKVTCFSKINGYAFCLH